MLHFSRLLALGGGSQQRDGPQTGEEDALLTSSNHTPRILKSVFTHATPASPASPLPQSSNSKPTGDTSPPLNRCSPKKIRKSSSLRNILHHNNDSHGSEGCIPSPRSDVFPPGTSLSKEQRGLMNGEEASGTSDTDAGIKSLGRKRSGSLKERAKAMVRRMSFSESDSPRPSSENLPPLPPMPPIPAESTSTLAASPSIESFAALSRTSSYGTPIRGPMYSKRGILRGDNVPGSGNSVRFVSRDQYRTITPNASTIDGSFVDAMQSMSPPQPLESSKPMTFLAKLHSASMTDTSLQPTWGHAGVAGEAGPSRPSSLTRSQGRNMAASFGTFASGSMPTASDRIDSSAIRLSTMEDFAGSSPVQIQIRGPASSDGVSTSPSKVVSFADLPSIDMGDLPEDMSNLMDGLANVTTDATCDVFNTATGNSLLSGGGMSSIFSDAGRTPMPKKWLRAAASPAESPINPNFLSVDSPPNENQQSRWSPDTSPGLYSPGEAGEVSLNSSVRSVGVMIVHDEESINGPERSSLDMSPRDSERRLSNSSTSHSPTPLPAAGGQQPSSLSPAGNSLLFNTRSNSHRAILHPPSLDPEEPVIASPSPVTPARADATVYLTPMSFMERSLSFGSSSETESPGEVDEEALAFARLPQALMRTSNNLMDAQETHVQIVQAERDRYRALSEKLQGELELRQNLMEKLKAQVRALRGSRVEVVASATTDDANEEAASVANLCASVERQGKDAAAERLVLAEEKTVLSHKLTGTEAELRDALIRMESLQRDVMLKVERENAMEAACRKLENQVEQLRSDKSVVYHHAREKFIMGHGAETVDAQGLRSLQAASQKDHEELVLLRQELRLRSESGANSDAALKREIGELREALEWQKSNVEPQAEHMAALESDNERLTESLQQCAEEKEDLEDKLRHTESMHKTEFAAEVAHLNGQVKILVDADETSAQVIKELRAKIKRRDEEVTRLEQLLSASQQEVKTLTRDLEEAEARHAREMSEGDRRRQQVQQDLNEATSKVEAYAEDLRAQRDSLHESVRASADANETRARLEVMSAEVDRLQQEVINMRSKSANKEVQITQLQKLRDQLNEDKEMLNIALDSKQQELEIMKRKFSVRGVAGTTPMPLRIGDISRHTVQDTPGPSKTLSKTPFPNAHQSSAFITPAMPSKTLRRSIVAPHSVAEGRRIITALGESARHNSMITPSLPVRSMISEEAKRHSLAGSVPTLDRRLTRTRARDVSAGREEIKADEDVETGTQRRASGLQGMC